MLSVFFFLAKFPRLFLPLVTFAAGARLRIIKLALAAVGRPRVAAAFAEEDHFFSSFTRETVP